MPSKLFGSEKKKQQTKSNGIRPARIQSRAGRSRFDSGITAGGIVDSNLRIDPIVERLRNESLRGFRSLVGSLNSDIDSLRGNQNAFIDARINPLQERFAQARGNLARDTARRGVFGSLANNELSRFDANAGRTIADQTALATNDALNAIQDRLRFQQSLFGNINTAGQQKLAQELSALGLESDAARTLISGNSSANAGSTTTQEKTSNPGLLGGLGTVLEFL